MNWKDEVSRAIAANIKAVADSNFVDRTHIIGIEAASNYIAAKIASVLEAEERRQMALSDMLEEIREQVRVGIAPEHRPAGLFQKVQDAVYAMRGRERLADVPCPDICRAAARDGVICPDESCDIADGIRDDPATVLATVEFAWIAIVDRLPPYNQIVVCTDQDWKHRWLDARMVCAPDLKFMDRTATHWYPVPDLGITEALRLDVAGLRDEILSRAAPWKGTNGGIFTVNAMALELAQALAPYLRGRAIYERCARIAELYGVGREKADYDGRDIAIRIRADAADFLARSRGADR